LYLFVVLLLREKDGLDFRRIAKKQYRNRYEQEYGHMVAYVNCDNISKVFTEINVINFGRAMAYLSIVYLLKESEEVTREGVRLVATPFDMTFQRLRLKRVFFID
jgi:energy-converting hydrogenase Eha subunit H